MSPSVHTRIDQYLLTGAHAFQEHLRENEEELSHHNILVRVESIHQAHRTAMCSVQQRNTGLLRRTRSVIELIWRAEQALAPLLTLGITPMVQVCRTRQKSPDNASTGMSAWSRRVAQRLGYPTAAPREPGSYELDPFGWRHAITSATSPDATSKIP